MFAVGVHCTQVQLYIIQDNDFPFGYKHEKAVFKKLIIKL